MTKRIIPCLDVKNGRVVKGVQFVGLRDVGDPVERALFYDQCGADELTFLDITASHEARGTLLDVVERTAEKIRLPLTVGGGVRAVADIRDLLNAGADKVSINTAAIHNPGLVSEASQAYGAQAIVVAIDAKRVSKSEEAPRWAVFTHGGRNNTELDAVQWAKEMAARGAGEILLTSMDRDGKQDGYDLELTCAVSEALDIPVIASGGVGSLEHFRQGLVAGKADAALAASVFHDGIFTIAQVKTYLAGHGVRVRPPRIEHEVNV